MIHSNFEQGLLKLKELVKDEQSGDLSLDFQEKEMIISLLLQMTT
jgi:hypothetical protein